MRSINPVILKIGMVAFFLFQWINLNAQNPKISSIERDSKDFLVTKLLLNNDNLVTNFIRLNDELEFIIEPKITKLYTYNLNVLAKKGLVSIKILDENNSIVDFIEINEIKKLNENFTKELQANKNYRLLIKGEKFKGKINLIWE